MSRTAFSPEVEEEIVRMYRDGVPMKDIIAKHGCGSDTVRRCARRSGIEMRESRRPQRKWSEAEVAEMYRMWESGDSQTAIAQRFDTAQVVVSRVLRLNGYELQSRPRRLSGEQHGSWRGGKTITSGGYVWVKVAQDDPMASMRGRQGYVAEHRLVMARTLGRPLTALETVHHIDGDVTHNDLSNLQLRQGKHGKGAVNVCLDCGSHNLGFVPIAQD